MPYPFNSPRWEFTHADRSTMQGIANNALAYLNQTLTNQTVSTNYITQIIGKGSIIRNNFDSMVGQINALSPTYNNGSAPPVPDIIP